MEQKGWNRLLSRVHTRCSLSSVTKRVALSILLVTAGTKISLWSLSVGAFEGWHCRSPVLLESVPPAVGPQLVFDTHAFQQQAACEPAKQKVNLRRFASGNVDLEADCINDASCEICPYRKVPLRNGDTPLVVLFAPSGGLTNQMDTVATGAWLALRFNLTYGIPQLHTRKAFVSLEETEVVELAFDEVFDLALFTQAADAMGLHTDVDHLLVEFPRRDLPILREPKEIGTPDKYVQQAIRQAVGNGHAAVAFSTALCYSQYYQADRSVQHLVAYFYSALLPIPTLRRRIIGIMASLPPRYLAIHVRTEPDMSHMFDKDYRDLGRVLSNRGVSKDTPIVLIGESTPDFVHDGIVKEGYSIVQLSDRAKQLKGDVAAELQGLIDMYVATYASIFWGCPASSYSLHIMARRRYWKGRCYDRFPDLKLEVEADFYLPNGGDGMPFPFGRVNDYGSSDWRVSADFCPIMLEMSAAQ